MSTSRRLVLGVLAAGLTAAALVGGLSASASEAGFKTTRDAMLALGPDAPANSSIEPLITVGETLPGGYRFEAIPDGIAVRARGQGRVDVFVNHETSTVPFPYVTTSVDEGESLNDFDNAQLSRLVLNRHSGGVLSGAMVVRSQENYQRFCSSYLATEREGFDRPLLFLNEEAQDWVYRDGRAWPNPSTQGFVPAGTDGAEQAGVVVAYDPQTGKRKTIYGMGRHNHENSVAVPGLEKVAVFSGDDTFSSNPPNSQLYVYIADGSEGVWNDTGKLYAFVAETETDYYGVTPGETVDGHFIEVPKHIATGKHPVDGDELTRAEDFPTWPAPPAGTPDGPQWVLDQWGNAANNDHGENVFDFIRIEDIAYDKRPGMSDILYLADSGRGSGAAPNGRVWKLDLDFDLDAPTPVLDAELSILVNGDASPVRTPTVIHQPDNIETTASGNLLVQEDPSSGNQFPYPSTDANRTTARIWSIDLDTLDMDVVARVASDSLNQKHLGDEEDGDVDPDDVPPITAPASALSPGALGAWETSGIIDVSSVFGEGVFLVTVQAHTRWEAKAPGDVDSAAHARSPDFTYKREGGQLVLLRLPGI